MVPRPLSLGPLPAEPAHPSQPAGQPSPWRQCTDPCRISRTLFAIKNVNVCFKEKCFSFKEVKTDRVIVSVIG